MDRKIRIAQYGSGKMGKILMSLALQKGGEISCAFDNNPNLIGMDIGSLIGIRHLGVPVSSSAFFVEVVKKTKPDICLIATKSRLHEVAPIYKQCIALGIDCISTAEEGIYPWNSAPILGKELDDLAKKGHVTLSATGYSDYSWGSLVGALAGAVGRIEKIKGYASYNVEDYGTALAQAHGIGLTRDEFVKKIPRIPSYMWNQNGWLCSKLGLEIISQHQKIEPIVAEDFICGNEISLAKGEIAAMMAMVTTQTAEGITLETSCCGKLYGEKEQDQNHWQICGDGNVDFHMINTPTPLLTCGGVINRIPQILNSFPGYITTDKMPLPAYLTKPLHYYVNR